MNHKFVFIIISLILFILLGFFREFFFVNLNYLLYKLYYHDAGLKVPALIQPFESLGYATIYWLKYLFTLISLGLFFSLSVLSAKWLSPQKKVVRFIGYTYLLLLILGAISMGIGYFINGRLQDDEYTLSRWLLGILQSPLPLLFFLATNKLLTSTSNH